MENLWDVIENRILDLIKKNLDGDSGTSSDTNIETAIRLLGAFVEIRKTKAATEAIDIHTRRELSRCD